MSEMDEVLEFWFPADAGRDLETHKKYWDWRMRGGADDEIVRRFSNLTKRAARGELNYWANTPHGRLALIVVLDQFPRSVWRGTPDAFKQDAKALSLVEEGFANGDFDKLKNVWEKTFYQMPLGHCEGPGLVDQVNRSAIIVDKLLEEAPAHLKPIYEFSAQQPREVLRVVEAFGRHPHRNAVLRRESSEQERVYLEQGMFPHQRDWEQGEITIPQVPSVKSKRE